VKFLWTTVYTYVFVLQESFHVAGFSVSGRILESHQVGSAYFSVSRASNLFLTFCVLGEFFILLIGCGC